MTREQLDAFIAFIHSPGKSNEVDLYKAFGFDLGKRKCTGCYGQGVREWPALKRICSKCHGSGWIEA